MPKRTIGLLGGKIRELLRQHRLSSRELGRRLGVSSGTVSNWCFDTWPRREDIQRLADAFGVPVQVLLVGYEDTSTGLNREVFSAASRAVRKALSEQGLSRDKISDDQYDHLVILAYNRATQELRQGVKADETRDTLENYLADLIPLLGAAKQ